MLVLGILQIDVRVLPYGLGQIKRFLCLFIIPAIVGDKRRTDVIPKLWHDLSGADIIAQPDAVFQENGDFAVMLVFQPQTV